MSLSTAQIKAALKAHRLTQAQIARQLDYSNARISDVIRGAKRSPHIEGAIARLIGREPSEVFPVVPVRVPPRRRRKERAA